MDIITKVQELIEELNGKMILLNLKKKNKMEIKIQIPDNCELVKEQPDHNTIISAITYYISDGRVIIMTSNFWNSQALSFPTRKMAVDFFECFRGLCETAKTLL